ncbi:MAG TPA: helix-turn-helix domain-containing protein, partial [Lacipirellulaceae bacterium]|nr:helix-turn-helix domain-containing protein [Lacipirellulaceae bacterium]
SRAAIKRPEAPLAPLLLTGAEAARLLRVSRRTLWTYTAPRGAIRPVRFGRNLRYSPAELQRWIDAQLSAAAIHDIPEASG